MLPKYKLLATLYLCQRFSAPSPSVDIFRHLLGVSYGQTVSRLLKDRFISQVEDVTAITYLGTNALLSHYPLLDYFNNENRGNFTLVVFNIPEEKRQIRDRLRYVLKSAGFGQINRSLYLSPHLTVKEARSLTPYNFEKKSSLQEDFFLSFAVPFESFKDIDKDTLTKFWDLEEVGGLYDEALAFAEEKPDGLRTSTRRVGESARFLSKFLDAFGKDPFLPALLLGNNWPGTKALEIAKEILTREN